MKSFAQNMKLIKLLLLNLNVVQSEEKNSTCSWTLILCKCSTCIQLINFHVESAVLVKLAIWMPESFLYREKCIELIMNKTAVIIVLAIFISAYIPNLFMDVNMQSSGLFASWTDDTLLQKKGKQKQRMLKELWGYLQKLAVAKTKISPYFSATKWRH